MLWDVFCRVIDNHGDLGVLWRLSCQLADRGHSVRLWVDDASALVWMAPDGHRGVQIYPWASSSDESQLAAFPMADVWIEGFGCEIESIFIAHFACDKSAEAAFDSNNPVWINLEYLTAERYAERCHGLPSPVLHGPATGHVKHFFYPGFTAATGGLLRERDLAQRQKHFNRSNWLAAHGIPWSGEQLMSLFCYEPAYLVGWLQQLSESALPTVLLVTAGRATHAVKSACQQLGWHGQGHGQLRLHPLPALTQTDYDHLLWASDMNAVRGEDSLVRALWARKPFLWHIYPQDDGAHHAKLTAFLDWADAPADVRQLHTWWNTTTTLPTSSAKPLSDTPTHPPQMDSASAQAWANRLADRLQSQPDLVTQLLASLPASVAEPAKVP